MSVPTEYRYKFGDAASIEKYLEGQCGSKLEYLKEKGVLHLVAEDFANESISKQFQDIHNKLVLILTDPKSGLDFNTYIINHSIIPILTGFLKECAQTEEVAQLPLESDQISNQNVDRNHYYYVVLAVIGITLSIFAAYCFGNSTE